MATKNIDTVVKDFDGFVEALIDFATSNYSEQTSANRVWTDFNISSFSRNWAEIVAYVADQLMFYLDFQSNQAYLDSATIPSFILNIAQQQGYEVATQQAATGKVKFVTSGPYTIPNNYVINAGGVPFYTIREITGSLAEAKEVEAIQGTRFVESFSSQGVQSESIVLAEPDIVIDTNNSNPELRSPIVRVNGENYTVVATNVDANANSKVAVRSLRPDGRTELTFGDDIFGRKLIPNENIQVIYRNGGGSQGNVEPNQITSLSSPLANVTSVNNETPFAGGVDRLSIEEIKKRIPLSLKTVAGAITIQDYASILIANYPQVLNANAAPNNTETGIDIDVFVLPQAETITKIDDNQVLKDTLVDFLNKKKTVTAKFLIRNAEAINVDMELEVYLNRDASRAALETEINQRLTAFFDLRTGGSEGTGIGFQETVKLGDIFDILKQIEGIDRFDIKKFTVIPRVEAVVGSPNQEFDISKVDVYPNVAENEWAVITDQLANPEPANGQVRYTVYKRTLATATTLTEDSIQDSNLDLTVKEGNAIVIQNTIINDFGNVFQLGQYDDYLLVDAANVIWRIVNTRAKAIEVSSPALSDAGITTVTNGAYRVVRSFAGDRVAVSGLNFTVLYNNRNTFFSPAANFNLIATNGDSFFLSQRQDAQGTYGVPVAITGVTPQGPNPGDLVNIDFNGNPNLSSVNEDFVLIDRVGNTFNVVQVNDDGSPVATYSSNTNLDDEVTLTDATDQAVAQHIVADKDVTNGFIEARFQLKKTLNPLGGVFAKLYADSAGQPGTLLAQSILVPTSIILSSFNEVAFTFAAPLSLTEGTKYHIGIEGDNAYKLSYANADGSIELGLDSSSPAYKPATTATANLSIAANVLQAQQNASAILTVTNNTIRSMALATGSIRLLSNDYTGGTHRVVIAGVPLEAGVDFVIGGSIAITRDNLLAAITANLSGIVTASSTSTDTIQLLAANNATYRGELGNSITMSVLDPGVANFQLSGATLATGLNGDRIIVEAPAFLNTGFVGYEYNENTGFVQFDSAVSLPTLVANDVFVDGAGTQHIIQAIDDANDRILLDVQLTVDNTVERESSGSIKRTYTLEFGVGGLAVGATANDTATNLDTYLDTNIPAIDTTAVTNTVEIESVVAGDVGNDIRITFLDIGTINFTISSQNLSGGQDPDTVSVDGTDLVAGVDFLLGANITDTREAIRAAIDALPTVGATLVADEIQVAAVTQGEAGNSIPVSVKQAVEGNMEFSSDTLVGGQDNLRLKTFDGSWSDYVPDSDAIFSLLVAADGLVVVSNATSDGDQIVPLLSVGGEIDSSLGKRYYSDEGEVSFLIATKSSNSFIIGSDNADIYGRGTVGGSSGVRVDQFIFRTSRYRDDIANLVEKEIPVLTEENIKLNLIGGVN
jgi:hypothetical protein